MSGVDDNATVRTIVNEDAPAMTFSKRSAPDKLQVGSVIEHDWKYTPRAIQSRHEAFEGTRHVVVDITDEEGYAYLYNSDEGTFHHVSHTYMSRLLTESTVQEP